MPYRRLLAEGVYACRWEGTPELREFEEQLEEMEAIVAQTGTPLVGLSIISETSGPPNPETARGMVALIDRLQRCCRRVIVVLEGRGLKHRVKLTLITWMVSLARTSDWAFIRGSVEEALIYFPPRALELDALRVLRMLREQKLCAPPR